MKKRLAATLSCALLTTMLLVPAAHAAKGGVPAKATPDPITTPDLPGCRGNINATFNHLSGIQDHDRDSKGPGYYFRDGQTFKAELAGARADFCG